MSDYDQTDDEIIEGEYGRLVNVGMVNLTDEDVRDYLKIDPKIINDEDFKKLGELLFEFMQDYYENALRKAYITLEMEKNDADTE